MENKLSTAQLLNLTRFSTPTIFNGWKHITDQNPAIDGINREMLQDFTANKAPMVGYAVTLVIEPGNPEHPKLNPQARNKYNEYIASIPGPKIVVVQDINKPDFCGSFWGEVNCSLHLALGCIGTIVDGAVRDVDEMSCLGFHVLARQLCVGHAYVHPVEWNRPVEVFGQRIEPGQLIHADKHGFLGIQSKDELRLLEAAQYQDDNENNTVISATRDSSGLTKSEIIERFNDARDAFSLSTQRKFAENGEW